MPNRKHGEKFAKAAQQYTEGKALEEVADEFGLSVEELRGALESRGVILRVRRKAARLRSVSFDAEVRRMTKAGMTAQEIAKELGCHRDTVQRVRRDRNVRGMNTGGTKAPGRKTVRCDRSGEVTHKWCPKCEQMLRADEFAQNSAAYYGLQTWCRACTSEVRKAKRRAS